LWIVLVFRNPGGSFTFRRNRLRYSIGSSRGAILRGFVFGSAFWTRAGALAA
jgi:hypothetical protein